MLPWLGLPLSSLAVETSAGDGRPATREENLRLKESPLWAEKVRLGELPPLEKRLPEHPRVVRTVEQPGVYGGTWRGYHIDPGLPEWRTINSYTPLVRWNASLDNIEPGLAESWWFEDDGKRIVLKLRKGLRWSDGEPFTSRDVLYWWSLAKDYRMTLFPPEWAYAGGKMMDVQAPDALTLVFQYSEPFYFMPIFLATGSWVPEAMLIPWHYMKQFDPAENPNCSEYHTFIQKNDHFNNPDRPTMSPWRLVQYGQAGSHVMYERNPYYYCVDSDGRQLPYIDRMESTRVISPASGVLMIMAGEVDAVFRLIGVDDLDLLKQYADLRNYHVLRWQEGMAAWHAACINWDVQDPAKRQIFRDRRFRRALAAAINREQINQIVWNGTGRPQNAAITDESWHFRSEAGQKLFKEWISAYSTYDPALANRLLDECGMDKRDREGFRLLNGQPFEIVIDFFKQHDRPALYESTLLAEDFQRVGVRTRTKPSVGADLWVRIKNGRFDMFLYQNGEMDLFSYPSWVFPTTNLYWHPLMGKWHTTGGREGEAPTGVMKRLLDIYDATRREPDLERRHELIHQAVRIHIDEGPFMLGTVGHQPAPVVIKNYFRNVPATGILGPTAVCQPGSLNPDQFFIDVYANDYAKDHRS